MTLPRALGVYLADEEKEPDEAAEAGRHHGQDAVEVRVLNTSRLVIGSDRRLAVRSAERVGRHHQHQGDDEPEE